MPTARINQKRTRSSSEEMPSEANFLTIAAASRIWRRASKFSQVELQLLRADASFFAQWVLSIAALVLIALCFGIVGLFVLAQAATAFLSQVTGAPVLSALIVALSLIALCALLFALIRVRVAAGVEGKSLIVSSLARHSSKAQSSQDTLTAKSKELRYDICKDITLAKNKLKAANVADELVRTLGAISSLKSHFDRYPLVAGMLTAALTWVLTRQTSHRKTKRKSQSLNHKMEYSHASQRSN